MAKESKLIIVSERESKVVGGKSAHKMKLVKTDGTAASADQAVLDLQKKGVHYFEVLNEESNTKMCYTKMISGKNYEKKEVSNTKK